MDKILLNKSEYYRHTGIITKKTVQKLFSIGKQNARNADLADLPDQTFCDCLIEKP